MTGVELDVSHIPGPTNVIADDLSTWSFEPPVPHEFQNAERIGLSLPQLWKCTLSATLHPPESKILRDLPSGHF
jgi:hypothetical protein